MARNLLGELLGNLLLLLELLLRDRGQIGEAADLHFVSHVLRVTPGEHLDGLHELIVDVDLVLKRAPVTIIEHVDLLGLVLQVNLEVHRAIDRVLNLLLLVRDLLNLIILVRELASQDRDSCLELFELSLVEGLLRLLASVTEYLLPLLGHLDDMLVEVVLAILSLLDILSRNGRVQTEGVFLSLHDEVSLQVHELEETFVFLNFEDEHIGLCLSLAKLNRKFARVIPRLFPEVVQLRVLVFKGVGQLVKLAFELLVLMAEAIELLSVEPFLIIESLRNSFLLIELLRHLTERRLSIV